MKKSIILSLLFLILSFFIIISIILFNNNIIINNLIDRVYKLGMEENDTTLQLESKENNYVLLVFENNNGIRQITAPNGHVIYANGKKKVTMDYKVEENMTYNFETINMLNNVSNNSFITPVSHIEITRNNINVDLKDIQSYINIHLNQILIATNFIKISTGEKNYIDSNSTEMSEVFNNWNSFGNGHWSYQSSSKTILNSANQDRFSGYFYPEGQFDDIELSFNAMTTDSDDDMIGAMIRFNQNNSSSYSSYLFLLDRHDNGGGVSNGAFNGINKIINKNLAAAGYNYGWNLGNYLTKLDGNNNIIWKRNTWQNYKLIAKGTTIKAYIDEILVASVTDSSIQSGTLGFLSLSQADTYFKDIVIKTEKSYTLSELVKNIEWTNHDINVVINLNNAVETSLSDNSLINYFNDGNIHYIGIGSDSNKSDTQNFINNINNRGIYLESTNYDNYMQKTIEYLSNILSY